MSRQLDMNDNLHIYSYTGHFICHPVDVNSRIIECSAESVALWQHCSGPERKDGHGPDRPQQEKAQLSMCSIVSRMYCLLAPMESKVVAEPQSLLTAAHHGRRCSRNRESTAERSGQGTEYATMRATGHDGRRLRFSGLRHMAGTFICLASCCPSQRQARLAAVPPTYSGSHARTATGRIRRSGGTSSCSSEKRPGSTTMAATHWLLGGLSPPTRTTWLAAAHSSWQGKRSPAEVHNTRRGSPAGRRPRTVDRQGAASRTQERQASSSRKRYPLLRVDNLPVSGVDSHRACRSTLCAPYPVLCTCTPRHWHLNVHVPDGAGRSLFSAAQRTAVQSSAVVLPGTSCARCTFNAGSLDPSASDSHLHWHLHLHLHLHLHFHSRPLSLSLYPISLRHLHHQKGPSDSQTLAALCFCGSLGPLPSFSIFPSSPTNRPGSNKSARPGPASVCMSLVSHAALHCPSC